MSRLKVGNCKCGSILPILDTSLDHDDFEGHIICHRCSRVYYWEMKKGTVRLGRCFRYLCWQG